MSVNKGACSCQGRQDKVARHGKTDKVALRLPGAKCLSGEGTVGLPGENRLFMPVSVVLTWNGKVVS